MPLVAGIDSSTQSCKVVIRDAATGRLERQGRASHPPGSQVDPEHWWSALGGAAAQAGGLDDVAAVAVAGQQHGLVALDNAGQVIRPAILWNDTRSAAAAKDLINELGGGSPQLGAQKWAKAVGTVPVASLTVTKLRWLAEHEPANAQRLAAACLPHDWLTWRLAETSGNISELVTDLSDASGTGYWSGVEATYRTDLLRLGLGKDCLLPRVLDPLAVAGHTPKGQILGPGAGDNA
ncbi:MAG: xylulose kinase, partial [Bifidobacteriaceae bacterium]|nr:xylulose kinase [Bifidobacteriaceae bacterium]